MSIIKKIGVVSSHDGLGASSWLTACCRTYQLLDVRDARGGLDLLEGLLEALHALHRLLHSHTHRGRPSCQPPPPVLAAALLAPHQACRCLLWSINAGHVGGPHHLSDHDDGGGPSPTCTSTFCLVMSHTPLASFFFSVFCSFTHPEPPTATRHKQHTPSASRPCLPCMLLLHSCRPVDSPPAPWTCLPRAPPASCRRSSGPSPAADDHTHTTIHTTSTPTVSSTYPVCQPVRAWRCGSPC